MHRRLDLITYTKLSRENISENTFQLPGKAFVSIASIKVKNSWKHFLIMSSEL